MTKYAFSKLTPIRETDVKNKVMSIFRVNPEMEMSEILDKYIMDDFTAKIKWYSECYPKSKSLLAYSIFEQVFGVLPILKVDEKYETDIASIREEVSRRLGKDIGDIFGTGEFPMLHIYVDSRGAGSNVKPSKTVAYTIVR